MHFNFRFFGKDIFTLNANKGFALFREASEDVKKEKCLPDFYTEGGNDREGSNIISEFISVSSTDVKTVSKKDKEKKKEEAKLTPKDVYEAKMLNEKSFQIKADPEYVDEQLKQFQEKLKIVKSEKDFGRGVKEISSLIIRLENRKKYKQFKTFYDQYPYALTSSIHDLMKKHSYLKIGPVEQFVADMPKEAIQAMRNYGTQTKSLCQKKPIFYIIADKKDFKQTQRRRDPILLAQSPFGHVWQILGVWDKEMLLLDEL